LNTGEIKTFKKYIDEIIIKTENTNVNFQTKSINKNNDITLIFLNKKFSRDNYILIFEKVLEIYNISKKIKIDSA
jgi:hypothetical protein